MVVVGFSRLYSSDLLSYRGIFLLELFKEGEVMGTFLWVVLITQCVVFGSFSAFVANSKNRGKVQWFELGFLFSIIALIAICGVPSLNLRKSNSANTDDGLYPNVSNQKEKMDLSFD